MLTSNTGAFKTVVYIPLGQINAKLKAVKVRDLKKFLPLGQPC